MSKYFLGFFLSFVSTLAIIVPDLKKTSRELGNFFGGVEYNVGLNRVVLCC